jgi:hypothetical protein
MIFTIAFCFVIGYIDYVILTPLLPIPDDICFYHTNTPPTWVRLFYLDSSGHTEPPFSGLHISALFFAGLFIGVLTARKVDNWLLKRKQQQNNDNQMDNSI